MAAEHDRITGDQLAAIARELSSIKARSMGKGPTGAKAYQCDQFIFCVLEGTVTPVERTLLDNGDEDMVRGLRMRYQQRMAHEYMGVVREVLDRAVLTYQSQVVFDPDYTIEIFVLADGEGTLPVPE